MANRFRRHETLPRKRVSERQFEEHRAILEPFLAPVMAERHAELFDACVHPER